MMKKIKIIGFLILLAVVSTGAGYLAFQIYYNLNIDDNTVQIEVPDITQMSEKQAKATLQRKGLKLVIDREVYDNKVPKGYVVIQNPLPEMYVEKQSEVNVTLSKGTENITVPELAGISERKARILLAKNGLSVGQISYTYSNEFPREFIITNSPSAQTLLKRGMEIDLLISLGPQKSTGYITPRLKGKNYYAVKRILEPLGIRVGKKETVYDEFLEDGTILEQFPRPGIAINKNDNLQLVISIGGEPNGY